jgi:uncharacterized protein (DUF1810 family)
MSRDDPHNLERFVAAEEEKNSYELALGEIRRGHKCGHWMWFVFPQIAGLGRSPTSRHFAIASLDEARAYLGHAVLGGRLLECASALLAVDGLTAEEIFGAVDALKLCSSMTLFMRAAPDEALFAQVLERYFAGQVDSATDERI